MPLRKGDEQVGMKVKVARDTSSTGDFQDHLGETGEVIKVDGSDTVQVPPLEMLLALCLELIRPHDEGPVFFWVGLGLRGLPQWMEGWK